jgi:xanthine dehydrogenase accessory factor
MEDIYRQMSSVLEKGGRGALASVLSRKGSAPMSADAKMIVFEDGSFRGTIGGGCMEADVWSEARRVLQRGTPSKLRFELTEKNAHQSGHICGGVVDILIEPLCNFNAELIRELIRLRDKGEMGVLVTLVSRSDGRPPGGDDRVLVFSDGSMLGGLRQLWGEIRQPAVDAMHQGKPSILKVDLPDGDVSFEMFLEPVMARPKVYVFGGGHVSQHLAKVAAVGGFRPVVVEDRVPFANRDLFPDAEEFIVLEDFDTLEEGMPGIDPSDMAVIVTRGHRYDETVLAWAFGKPFRYLGMIGSRTKILLTYGRLEARMGIPKEEFIRRVHAPVGLEIGASTPGEIAVAIVAELIQVLREALIQDPKLSGMPKSAGLMKSRRSGDRPPSQEIPGNP